jgi:hypothetical protein
MKRVLIIGRLTANIPTANEIAVKNVKIFPATNLAEVRSAFEKNDRMDIVIMGAGIELETRLEIVKYVFTASDSTTVHMKDLATGPEGFLPFINDVLKGLVSNQ